MLVDSTLRPGTKIHLSFRKRPCPICNDSSPGYPFLDFSVISVMAWRKLPVQEVGGGVCNNCNKELAETQGYYFGTCHFCGYEGLIFDMVTNSACRKCLGASVKKSNKRRR